MASLDEFRQLASQKLFKSYSEVRDYLAQLNTQNSNQEKHSKLVDRSVTSVAAQERFKGESIDINNSGLETTKVWGVIIRTEIYPTSEKKQSIIYCDVPGHGDSALQAVHPDKFVGSDLDVEQFKVVRFFWENSYIKVAPKHKALVELKVPRSFLNQVNKEPTRCELIKDYAEEVIGPDTSAASATSSAAPGGGGDATGGGGGGGGGGAVPQDSRAQKANKHVFAKAMDKAGITDNDLRAAIVGVIGGETNFKLNAEFSYAKTPLAQVKSALGPRLSKLSDAEIEVLKKDPVKFFEYCYGCAKGGRTANGNNCGGNDIPGDGYKYRGRGYIQITFKGNYRQLGDKIKRDLVGNPDLLNTAEVAAEATVAYLLINLPKHRKYTTNIERVIRAVSGGAEITAKSRKVKTDAYLRYKDSGEFNYNPGGIPVASNQTPPGSNPNGTPGPPRQGSGSPPVSRPKMQLMMVETDQSLALSTKSKALQPFIRVREDIVSSLLSIKEILNYYGIPFSCENTNVSISNRDISEFARVGLEIKLNINSALSPDSNFIDDDFYIAPNLETSLGIRIYGQVRRRMPPVYGYISSFTKELDVYDIRETYLKTRPKLVKIYKSFIDVSDLFEQYGFLRVQPEKDFFVKSDNKKSNWNVFYTLPKINNGHSYRDLLSTVYDKDSSPIWYEKDKYWNGEKLIWETES